MIDDAEYARVLASFNNRWKDPDDDPTSVYIGCPHNTYDEILHLEPEDRQSHQGIEPGKGGDSGRHGLLDRGEEPTVGRASRPAQGTCSAPVCSSRPSARPAYQGLKGMADIDRGVTNSNKARYYSRLRLFGDDDLLEIAMTGKIPA